MPDSGRGRTWVGHTELAKLLVRFGPGALSLADSMELPPLVVTARSDLWEPTLGPVRQSKYLPPTGTSHQQ